ncbi:MAG: hypothetical protein KIT31_27110 [Deltaproteobacteria bacterium]|nr:hypothetical protein [Deltaproteobacteria bacterium]
MRDHPEVFVNKLLPFVVLVVACVPVTPVVSSKAVLGPQRSEVLVQAEPQPVALEVVRIFTARGFPLADMQGDGRGIWLHLKGTRRTAVEPVDPNLDVVGEIAAALDTANGDPMQYVGAVHDVTYGSAFYVRIEPRGTGTSHVSIVGRVIRNGAELCTADPGLGPCVENEDALTEPPGAAEADVVTGVFAELRLGGGVLTPDPRPTPEQVAAGDDVAACRAYRAEQMMRAHQIEDVKARASVLGALPVCEP